MSLLAKKTKKGSDNFQTPEWPLQSLLDEIQRDMISFSKLQAENGLIFDPCCGKGGIVNFFLDQGYDAIGKDINPVSPEEDDGLSELEKAWAAEARGEDIGPEEHWEPDIYNFLVDDLPKGTTCIITNPPYSLKDQFLARCYEHELPFALLLPVTALEGKKRQAMYKEHGMQLLVLPDRVNFHTPSGKGSGSWFHTDWFTNGFEFRKDMIFV